MSVIWVRSITGVTSVDEMVTAIEVILILDILKAVEELLFFGGLSVVG